LSRIALTIGVIDVSDEAYSAGVEGTSAHWTILIVHLEAKSLPGRLRNQLLDTYC